MLSALIMNVFVESGYACLHNVSLSNGHTKSFLNYSINFNFWNIRKLRRKVINLVKRKDVSEKIEGKLPDGR